MSLSMITSQNSEGISIMKNGEYSSLINIDSSKNLSGIFLKSNNSRPLRCSELKNKLDNRKYNLWNLKYVSTERIGDEIKIKKEGDKDNLFTIRSINPFSDKYDIENLIPKINTVVGLTSSTVGINSSIYLNNTDKWNYTEQELEAFNSDPSFKNNGWIDKYSSAINKINLSDIGIGIVLINRNSDIYTDTIDFRNIINYSRQPDITAYLDLEIGCTIEKTKDSYEFFTRVSKFTLFKYSEIGELKQEDFILEVNDDILVEFVGGILRVIPSNSKITECIINNCILEYGKLN
jgi:hypothetical protein